MKYVIKASNVACLVWVQIGEGADQSDPFSTFPFLLAGYDIEGNRREDTQCYIYMGESEDKPVEAASDSEPPFEQLPPVVQKEILNWFTEVSALPIEERGAWSESKKAVSVTV